MKRMLKNKFILCLCLGVLAGNVEATQKETANSTDSKKFESWMNAINGWIDVNENYERIFQYIVNRGYLGYIEDQFKHSHQIGKKCYIDRCCTKIPRKILTIEDSQVCLKNWQNQKFNEENANNIKDRLKQFLKLEKLSYSPKQATVQDMSGKNISLNVKCSCSNIPHKAYELTVDKRNFIIICKEKFNEKNPNIEHIFVDFI